MISTHDKIHSFLACFDNHKKTIIETLYTSLRLSTTIYAELEPAKQDELAKLMIVGLRKAMEQKSVSPLIEAIYSIHLDDLTATSTLSLDTIQALLTLIRRSSFAALTNPCLIRHMSAGVIGLDLLCKMLEQTLSEIITHHLHDIQNETLTLHNSISMLHSIIEASPNAIATFNPNGEVIYANASFQETTGYGKEATGIRLYDLIVPEDDEAQFATHQFATHQTWHGTLTCQHKNGETFPGDVAFFPIYDAENQVQGQAIILRDISNMLHTEELETPLIVLEDHVVAMPLIGSIDESRAQRITETLLEGVAANRATMAILDITGVPDVDNRIATTLIQTAQAARLLGAQIILTGIRPDVAITLVKLGIDMRGIVTRSRFKAGVAYALAHRHRV